MNNQPSQDFLPWHLSWLTLALAIITIGTFIAVSGPSVRYGYVTPMMGVAEGPVGYGKGGGVPPMMDTSAGSAAERMMYPYPYPNPSVPATDMRELLQISYNASLRTSNVPKLTRRVETVVRGHGGRIDQQSSSEEYGYVSFALPENKYVAFRSELESLVGSRFLSVNISSQNLLSQKLSIEEQQKQADTMLADYKTARQKLVSAHTSTVQSLQAQIDASTPDSAGWLLLTKQLLNENSTYTDQLANADANIKYAQDWVKAVETQDQTLLENVATVTGTISLQKIGLWDSALLYLPGYWIPFIFAVLTGLSYRRDLRRAYEKGS